MTDFIPVNEPLLSGNEKKYLGECIDSGWISSEGPFVRKFEEKFAGFTGVASAIAVCNGTAALETALYSLDIKAGDEVIMPSFTIISCAISCIRLGAVPVLVDIDPATWTMDVTQIESKITDKTKAIMPVHIYGHPVDMDEIFRLQEKYDLLILEDFAEAHGAEYYSNHRGGKWLQCGTMGDVSATSFYANKILTTGEGGMVLTDNDIFEQRARSYRNLCFGSDQRFYHDNIGYNFRMTNLQAAVGLAQLEQINEFLKIKRTLGAFYRKHISKLDGIRFMPVKDFANSVYWMNAVELEPKNNVTASEMMERLKKQGVGTRSFFRGLHEQPALQQLGLFTNQNYPCTEAAYRNGFYLPSGLTLTSGQAERVVDALKSELYSATK